MSRRLLGLWIGSVALAFIIGWGASKGSGLARVGGSMVDKTQAPYTDVKGRVPPVGDSVRSDRVWVLEQYRGGRDVLILTKKKARLAAQRYGCLLTACRDLLLLGYPEFSAVVAQRLGGASPGILKDDSLDVVASC